MADDDFDFDGQQDYSPGDLRQQLKEANARAKAAESQAAEAAALRHENAVIRAGLELNEAQTKALAAVHQGDWTKDSVLATAQSLGFHQPPAPAPVVDDPSLAVHSQIAAAAAGAETHTPDRDADIDARIQKAETQEEVMAIYAESGRQFV